MIPPFRPPLLAGLVLLLSWGWPAFADAASARREELQIEAFVKASNPEEAFRASERLRARDLHAILEKAGLETLGVRAIQRDLLDDDTVLLEYLLGESKSYVWTFTSSSFRMIELPPRSEIDPLVRALRDSLVQSHQPAQHARAELVANQVSNVLLRPIAAQIAGKRNIALVLDGSLQSIPFAVLPDPWDMRSSLLIRHQIVVLPSASTLAALRRREASRAPPTKLLAILADPVFSDTDPRLASAASHTLARRSASGDASRDADSNLSNLARLPFSQREAEAIRALFPQKNVLTALGFQASRELAMSPELARYRFLHFATHAVQDGSHPDRSAIALSQFTPDGRRQEGLLDVQAIRSLDLSADLVVLSACQTALGREMVSDDLSSLSQGFLAAGAHRVVASLWSVSDAATAQFMTRFYRNLLQEGLSPAAALRKTQVEMSREARWRAPYYWAGFVLQGEWK